MSENSDRETQPTLAFQRILQRAVMHVQSSGGNEVTGANALVSIFSEQQSQAVYLLQKQNVTRLDVVNAITHGGANDVIELQAKITVAICATTNTRIISPPQHRKRIMP